MGINDDAIIDDESKSDEEKYILLEKLVSKTILGVFVKNSDGDPLKRGIVSK